MDSDPGSWNNKPELIHNTKEHQELSLPTSIGE